MTHTNIKTQYNVVQVTSLIVALVFMIGISIFPMDVSAAGKIKAKVNQILQNRSTSAIVNKVVSSNNSAVKAAVVNYVQNNTSAVRTSTNAPSTISQYAASHPGVAQYVANNPGIIQNIQNSPALQTQVMNYIQDNTLLSAAAVIPVWQDNNSQTSLFSNEVAYSYADTVGLGGNTSDSTSGYVYMNYDNNGGHDPDCVGFFTNGGSYAVWGDGIGSGNSTSPGQFNFCLDHAVRYASGVYDISGLQVSYVQVAQMSAGPLSNPGNGSSEENGTYVTYRVSFGPNNPPQCVAPAITSTLTYTGSVGQSMTYTATASNASSVTLSASTLPNGLSINGATISGIPTQAGTYYVTVTARSNCGAADVTRTLVITVNNTNPNTLSVSCSPTYSSVNTGDSVTWVAYPVGGMTPYTYTWSGTDGLSGSNISTVKTYTTSGTKTASITVASADGQVVVRPCSNLVVNQTQQSILTGACSASASTVNIGQSVTWNASGISGGTLPYTYTWTGSDGLYTTNSNASMTYYTGGYKNASMVVRSADGQSITRDCGTTYVSQYQPPVTITGSCSPSSSYVNSGQSVTWNAVINNGYYGTYTYAWYDNSGYIGSGASVYRSYSGSGVYSAYVQVTGNNGQSTTIYCSPSVTVQQYNPPVNTNLSISCSPSSSSIQSGQSVTWRPYVSGGVGPYQYSWSGSDGFYSSVVSPSRSYYTSGTQTATLTVISNDGQYRTATCSPSVYVNPTYVYASSLAVSCAPSISQINPGQTTTWTANATGGTGSYTYTWNGTSGLTGYTRTISKTYPSVGTQTASVTVTSSDGQTITRSCNPVIVAPVTVASCNYLNDYLRIDWDNDPTEVRKVQIFLRDLEGYTNLQVTGVFNQATFDAVSTFQAKYVGDVLSPWGSNESTGFVYILTKKKINEIYCQKAFPLTTQQQSEIIAYRNFLQSLTSAGIITTTNPSPVTTPTIQQNTEDLFRLSNEEIGLLMQNGGLVCRVDNNGICIPGTGIAAATTTRIGAISNAFSNLGAAIVAGVPNMFGGLRQLFILLLVLLGIFLITVGLIHRLPVLATLETGGFLAPDVLSTFIWVTGIALLLALLFGANFLAIPLLVVLILTVVALWIKHVAKPKVVEDN